MDFFENILCSRLKNIFLCKDINTVTAFSFSKYIEANMDLIDFLSKFIGVLDEQIFT